MNRSNGSTSKTQRPVSAAFDLRCSAHYVISPTTHARARTQTHKYTHDNRFDTCEKRSSGLLQLHNMHKATGWISNV